MNPANRALSVLPSARRARLVPLAAALLLLPALAGCSAPTTGEEESRPTYAELGYTGSDPTGRDPGAWPDVGGKLRILDNAAFSAFDVAARQFRNLTGVEVTHDDFGDTGSSLNVALREAGDPSFDVFYGIDNILYTEAVSNGVLDAYKPKLASRIGSEFIFFDRAEGWYATPVDHGYIGVNWDPNWGTGDSEEALVGAPLHDLHDVRANADKFVTEDPRYSTPGLGFLISTIATFGEPDGVRYDWHDYWDDLFEGGVLVTQDWTTAYEQHFSAGYGVVYSGGLGDKPLVTSYTNSPAFEHYGGTNETEVAENILAPGATFHQVQTMAVLEGARNLAAAQAWVEFTLTDFFQELAAPKSAVYPVVASVSVEEIYGDVDPVPCASEDNSGCDFHPADVSAADIGRNLARWLDEWTGLCEAHECA